MKYHSDQFKENLSTFANKMKIDHQTGIEPFILEKTSLMFAGTPRGWPLPLDDGEKERSHLSAKANSKVSRLSFPKEGKAR